MPAGLLKAAARLARRVPKEDWLHIDDIIQGTRKVPMPAPVRFKTLRPWGAVLNDVEQAAKDPATGISSLPLRTGLFDPLEAARHEATVASVTQDAEAARHFALVAKSRRRLMGDYLMGTPAEKLAARGALSTREMERVRALRRNTFDPLFQRWFGRDSSEFFNDVIPRHREAGTTITRDVYRQGGSPAEADLLRFVGMNNMINPLEQDIARMTAGVIRAGFWREYVDDAYRQAVKFANSKAIPTDLRPHLNRYLHKVQGSDALVENIGPIYQKFFKLLGHDVPTEDVRNLVTVYTSMVHAGLLGLRVGPLVRNLFAGPTITAPRIGMSWYLKGVKESMTKRGRLLFAESGILDEQATILDKLQDVTSGPVSKVAHKTARIALRPYSKVDMLPRAHAFHGMRLRIEDAARRLPRGASDQQFYKETALSRFHPVQREQIKDFWRAGNIKEAAMQGGVLAQQDTQWIYRQGFRPQLLSSEGGRILGQFGIWPLNYVEYLGQMFKSILFYENWGVPRTEGLKWFGEWLAAQAAVVGAFGGTGAALGMGASAAWHTIGWTGGGPLYFGGPALDLITSLDGMFYETVVSGRGENTREFVRNLESLVPGGSLLKDIAKAQGKSVRLFPPEIKKSRTFKKPRSRGEQIFRVVTGANPRKD